MVGRSSQTGGGEPFRVKFSVITVAVLAFASAGGPQTARAPAYELVGELLSEDGATRKNAADELRRLQDKTLLAALHDVVSFFQRVDERRAREVARLM